MNGGRKVPPQFQRSDAQDLLTVVFPDQQACAENLVGEREIPDHPLVAQTLHDCLHETMDVDGFVRLLERIESGEVEIVTRDLASPSPLSHAILNARPYAFLDDGAAEERRTKAVATQALMDLQTAHDIGRLDPQVIAQVREDAWPEIGNADELHDALCVHGFLASDEIDLPRVLRVARSAAAGDAAHRGPRSARCSSRPSGCTSCSRCSPTPRWRRRSPPCIRRRPTATPRCARSCAAASTCSGPMTAAALAAPLGLDASDVQIALLQLEGDGSAMRGAFTAPGAAEWCDRRLLARMHRATRDKLRADIQPVPPAQFMRFLFRWHQLAGSDGADGDERREGEGGLADVLRQLEGHAAPASAWEEDLLAARVHDYEPAMLDKLCAVGRVVWWRPIDGYGRAQDRAHPRHADRARRARCVAALAAGRRRGRRRPAAVEQGARRCSRRCARTAPASSAICSTTSALLGEPSRAGAGRAGGAGPGHLRHLRRPARAGDAHRQAQQAAPPPRRARPDRRCRPLVADAAHAAAGRRCRRAGRAARRPHRARAAAPLRRGVSQAARARRGPAAVARPALRVPPARGARRGARRPLRQRLLGRAVRAARGRGGIAQDGQASRAASACRSRPSTRSTSRAS